MAACLSLTPVAAVKDQGVIRAGPMAPSILAGHGLRSPVARALRRNPTDAERQLWSRLRRRQLEGFRLRRQVPLGPYVVDLACLSARLVVEVDGGQHSWQSGRDATRTAWLESAGFRVVRFWNNEVLANTEGVVERIREALKTPLPDPPPQGGRKGPGAHPARGERA